MQSLRYLPTLLLIGVLASPVVAQEEQPAPKEDLAQSQLQLLRDFERFEKSLYDVAEFSRRSDPERADLLFRARSQSQEKRVLAEMQSLADLLKPQADGKLVLGDTPERQAEVVARLREILKVLQSADERERLQKEVERVQDLLKDTNRIIGKQRDMRADTGRSPDPSQLADRERDIAADAEKLAEKIDRQDSERNGESPEKSSSSKKSESQDDSGDSKPKDGDEKSPSEQKPREPGANQEPGDEKNSSEGEPKDPQKSEDGKPSEKQGSEEQQSPSPSEKSPSEQSPSEQSPGQPSPSTPQQQQPGEQQQPQQGGQPKPPQELGQPSEPQSQQAPSPQGTPPEQDSSKTPGREQLEEAREQMQKAIEELLKKQKEEAGESQQQALDNLQVLKAQLEEILRQLREEEKEMMLATLESRLEKIRKAQLQVNAETKRLEKIPAAERGDRHLDRTVALSRDQRTIVVDAEHALELLKEEGSSVAFPEAIEQMRDNMLMVADRLNKADTGETTQLLEELIVESLDEMLLAVKQEMDRQKEKKQQSPQQQQQQQQGDKGLVEKIAELKMIRSLQNQINRVTRQIGREIEGEQTTDPAQRKIIDDLARRQKRLQQATYDLAVGKNK